MIETLQPLGRCDPWERFRPGHTSTARLAGKFSDLYAHRLVRAAVLAAVYVGRQTCTMCIQTLSPGGTCSENMWQSLRRTKVGAVQKNLSRGGTSDYDYHQQCGLLVTFVKRERFNVESTSN